MAKKISFLVLVLAFVVTFSLPVLAAPGDSPVANETTGEVADVGGAPNAGESTISKEPEGTATQNPSTEAQAAESKTASIALDKIVSGGSIETTDQFLVTITRPEGDENTFKKSYVICGISDEKDIEVRLAIYNQANGLYEDFVTTDGVSSWDAESLFTKEILLGEGANKIKIVAYKKSEADNLKVGVNAQVNVFTVTLLKEGIKDKILNGVLKITEVFEGILPQK